MLKRPDGTGLIRKSYSETISLKQAVDRPPPQVQLKQIPRVRLVHSVRELVTSAVGDDRVAAGLECLQVVRDPGAGVFGSSSVGSWTTTRTPFAFTRFMTPWMELARKLSELDIIVRRHTPTTGFGLPSYTRSNTICNTSSTTKSLRVRFYRTLSRTGSPVRGDTLVIFVVASSRKEFGVAPACILHFFPDTSRA